MVFTEWTFSSSILQLDSMCKQLLLFSNTLLLLYVLCLLDGVLNDTILEAILLNFHLIGLMNCEEVNWKIKWNNFYFKYKFDVVKSLSVNEWNAVKWKFKWIKYKNQFRHTLLSLSTNPSWMSVFTEIPQWQFYVKHVENHNFMLLRASLFLLKFKIISTFAAAFTRMRSCHNDSRLQQT